MKTRWLRTAGLLICLLVLGVRHAGAQDNACLSNELAINRVTNGSNVAIGGAVTKVADKDPKRCQLLLMNQGAASVTCMSTWQGAPSPTSGVVIPAGQQLAQQTSGRGEWRCTATTGTASTLLVLEELPNVP
jgi:hypothetical protein